MVLLAHHFDIVTSELSSKHVLAFINVLRLSGWVNRETARTVNTHTLTA